jgi:uncharacterized Zn-finger protein
MSKFFDRDFSCFFCRKKCFSKEKFFSHFRTHFNKTATAVKRRHAGSPEEASDEGSEGEAGSSASVMRRRKIKRMKMQRSSEDADSGCHSVESGSGGSSDGVPEEEQEESSDCFLGDDSQTSSSSDEENDENGTVSNRRNLNKRSRVKRPTNRPRVSQKDRLSLAEKQLDNNETEGLICLTCLKRFSNCQNLRRHLRLHIARDSITPDIDKSDGNKSDGDANCGDSGRFICDWCPARFDNRSASRIHEAGHKGQETRCYVCDKSYADRYSLRYHLRTHGIGRQIRCEYCNKSFSKPSRLDAHVRSHHHNIRDFVCSACDKAFKTRMHLRNHFRQHSGERPFSCGECGAGFRHKASLVAHSRSHDGARPFCCEVCGKTFRDGIHQYFYNFSIFFPSFFYIFSKLLLNCF